MATGGAAAALAGAAGKKEAAHALRWVKRFAALKPTPPAPVAGVARVDPASKKITFSGRYTNFSLHHVWEKWDYLQTHLLLREVVYSQVAQNPHLMDLEIDYGPMPTLYTRLPDDVASSVQETNGRLQSLAEGSGGSTTAEPDSLSSKAGA